MIFSSLLLPGKMSCGKLKMLMCVFAVNHLWVYTIIVCNIVNPIGNGSLHVVSEIQATEGTEDPDSYRDTKRHKGYIFNPLTIRYLWSKEKK